MMRILCTASVVLAFGFTAQAGYSNFDPSCKAAQDPSVTMPELKGTHSGSTGKSGVVGASEGAKKICADFAAEVQKACGDDMNAVASDGSSVTNRNSVSETMNQGAAAIDDNSSKVSSQFNKCSDKYSDYQDDCKATRDTATKALQSYEAQVKNGSCDPEGKAKEAKENLAEAKSSAREADSAYNQAQDKTKTTLAQNGQAASEMRNVASQNASGDGDQAMAGFCFQKFESIQPVTMAGGAPMETWRCRSDGSYWTNQSQCEASCRP